MLFTGEFLNKSINTHYRLKGSVNKAKVAQERLLLEAPQLGCLGDIGYAGSNY